MKYLIFIIVEIRQEAVQKALATWGKLEKNKNKNENNKNDIVAIRPSRRKRIESFSSTTAQPPSNSKKTIITNVSLGW